MIHQSGIGLCLVLLQLVLVLDASPGDTDLNYRACLERCEKTGCVSQRCFSNCKVLTDGIPNNNTSWYMQEPLHLKWKKWDCQADCRYYCMVDRENERQALGHAPVKYHGKWPFKRAYGIQEPFSVAFSVLNLAMHFHCWLSFFILVYYKLPVRQNKQPYFEFSALWHIYGFLSMNSWLWSSIFHCRDVDLTERLDYSSAVASLGFSLIMAMLRCFSVHDGASRVMVAAPLLAFVTTHIMFLNFYQVDYGWNMQVCVVMAVAQLLLWAAWAGLTHHPSRHKLWLVVTGFALAMLLEIYDFPPYKGFVDSHALWHFSTIPLTYLWWSFIKDDAKFCTYKHTRKEN